ncbi:MAG: hypothetical protein WC683_08860 [bacterium]
MVLYRPSAKEALHEKPHVSGHHRRICRGYHLGTPSQGRIPHDIRPQELCAQPGSVKRHHRLPGNGRQTGPDNLTLGYSSDNPALVPADDDHIILGGSGKDRTVLVRPEPGRTGQATITITVTDTDGETNQDGFEVEVVQAPKI